MVKKLKGLFSFVLALLLLFTIAACGSNNDNGGDKTVQSTTTGKATEKATEKNQEPVTLSFVFPQGGVRDFVDIVNNKFTSENPNIKVDKLVVPDNQITTLVQTKLATGEVPDLIFDNVGAFTNTYKPSDVMDLSNEPWVSNLVNPDGAKVAGVIRALPRYSAGEPLGIVYNKKMFSENNLAVPKTWQDFLKICETLKAKGITPMCMTNKDGWNTQIWPLTGFSQYIAGTDTIDKINNNQMKHADIKEFETALGQLKELVDKGYCNDDHLSVGFDNVTTVLGEEKAAMGCYFANLIGEIPKKYPAMEGNIGFFATPTKDDPQMVAGGTNCYAIFAKSAHPEEAKQLLTFWATDWAYNEVYKVIPGFPAMKDSTFALIPAYQEIFDSYIKTGKMVAQYNDFIKVDAAKLLQYEQDMVAGGKTPLEVLQAWDTEFVSLMKAKKMPGF